MLLSSFNNLITYVPGTILFLKGFVVNDEALFNYKSLSTVPGIMKSAKYGHIATIIVTIVIL